MELGVGSPAGLSAADGDLVVDWARRIDDSPFASLGIIDRVRYGNYDPLVTLAAAAAVTSNSIRRFPQAYVVEVRKPQRSTTASALYVTTLPR